MDRFEVFIFCIIGIVCFLCCCQSVLCLDFTRTRARTQITPEASNASVRVYETNVRLPTIGKNTENGSLVIIVQPHEPGIV